MKGFALRLVLKQRHKRIRKRPIGIRCWFAERGKLTGKPGEKPSEQGKNQQQTQSTSGTGSAPNLGHISGRRAATPLHHPCSAPSPHPKCLLSHKHHSDDNFVTSYYICSLYIPGKCFYLPSQMELDPFEPAGTPWASLQDQTLTKITAWRHQGSLEPRLTWFLRQSETENGRKDFKNLPNYQRSFLNTELESETKAKRAREETRVFPLTRTRVQSKLVL